MEVQIRTSLADTLAEQYHDVLYKQKGPVLATEDDFTRKNIEDIGGKLNLIDQELEIDYEDHVTERLMRIDKHRKKE